MEEEDRLLDYRALAGRLATAALALGAVTFVAIVVQGVAEGLTFRLMGRWVALFAAAYLVVAALVTAVHAGRGARRARRKDGRVGSRDIGLLPRRPVEDDGD